MREILKDVGLFVLRAALGAAMFFGHGLAKFQGYSEMVDEFPDPIGIGSQASLILAIFAEFVCSVLIAFGLLTRLAVIPLITTMVVALFIVHADDPWKTKELAAIFLIGFSAVLIAGPGRFSTDHLIWGRIKQIDDQTTDDVKRKDP